MTIKAINTVYAGYKFRSRLEARWAVFFDAMHLDWEYEPEGFELESGARYLPDFRVKTPQGLDVWYEVKPRDILGDAKFEEFAGSVGRSALLSGDPVDHFGRVHIHSNGLNAQAAICPRCGMIKTPGYGVEDFGDEYAYGCEPCDFETPCGGDNESEPGFLLNDVRPHKGWIICGASEYAAIKGAAERAAMKSRQARFEHGEVPA